MLRRTAIAFLLARSAVAQDAGEERTREEGRSLFVRAACVRCHEEPSPGALRAQTPAGPDLRSAGSRLAPAWMQTWIADPRALHATTWMPALVAPDSSDARDIATWLGSLGGPLGELDNPWGDGEGEALFTKRGCIACHGLAPASGAPDSRRMLHDLPQKTTTRRLADRIEHPLALAPQGNMPDLRLARGEAEAIAGFLLAAPKHAAFAPGDAARGESRFVALRCARCHESPARAAAAPAPSLAAITGKSGGCLAEQVPAGLPRYGFTSAERGALRAFLVDPGREEAPARELERRTRDLGCVRCHAFPAGGGMPQSLLQALRDAVAADSSEGVDPPDLTKVHERLRLGYVRDVLETGQRARPYSELRMPAWPKEQVRGLAELLCKADVAVARPSTVLLAEAGRRLAGVGGFACITCHDFAGQPALGQRGPDLTRMHARLDPEFLRRWIADPAAVRPGTRMPSFFAGGRSAITTELGGDAQAQLDALLAYLALGPRMAPPIGLKPPGETVIVPSGRPIVLRTEFPGTEVRTIAIGFPGGLSLALETAKPALAYVWEGGFVDMHRKWTGRGDGPCDLVGGVVFQGGGVPLWPRGEGRFGGYEIQGDEVAVLYGRGSPDQLRLLFAPRTSEHGRGLRIRLEGRRRDPFRLRVGSLLPGGPGLERIATSKQALAVLAAPPDCTVCATGTALVAEGKDLELELTASGSAEVTLWFVAAATPAVKASLMEETR